ncbi:hypothetical protein ACIRQP_40550 [Streptomyces sp. NPDC102274]|uniref:hypothetical protein n=1 Tax=Streptomyces sp. NPDC102274 TaxID=3366151 RepID=UPI0038293E75
MYDVLRGLGPHLVFWQGVQGADADNGRVFYEASFELGLDVWPGEKAHTAVLADRGMFRPLGELSNPSSVLSAPPTTVAVQLSDTGLDSTPLCVVAGRVSSTDEVTRRSEALLLASRTASMVTLLDGQRRRALVIGGFDAAVCADPLMDGMPRTVFQRAGLADVALLTSTEAALPSATGPDQAGYTGWLTSSRQLSSVWERVRTAGECGLPGHGMVAWAHRDHLASLLTRLRLPIA